MKTNYDVCIFDLDGTLVDSLEDLADSCNMALSLFELPTHTNEEYKFFVGNGIRELVRKSMGDAAGDKELLDSVSINFNMIYQEKCLNKTKPYNGIEKMLCDIKYRGVKIGVLSNKADDFAKKIVSSLFDPCLIDIVYGQKKGLPTKPEPDSLFEMLGKFECPKNKCLYIGDSNIDVATAQNAGVDFCGVEWGFRGYDELKNAGAELIAKTPSEVASIVNSSYFIRNMLCHE